jgi:hypothetical protein
MSKVWVFFYGTFMSATVLRHHGLDCDTTYPAKLAGYSLTIQPRVNLIKNAEAFSYGGLAVIEQSALANLYAEVHKSFGFIYYPQPILAETPDGLVRPALCFISEEFSEGEPVPEYINEMIKCAREMKAPENYISHIKSFGK